MRVAAWTLEPNRTATVSYEFVSADELDALRGAWMNHIRWTVVEVRIIGFVDEVRVESVTIPYLGTGTNAIEQWTMVLRLTDVKDA